MIPSFLSLAEGFFKKVSAHSVSGKIENQYKVHVEKAPNFNKHLHLNSVVVAASQLNQLMRSPFEPMAMCDLRLLIFKTAFLLAITSARHSNVNQSKTKKQEHAIVVKVAGNERNSVSDMLHNKSNKHGCITVERRMETAASPSTQVSKVDHHLVNLRLKMDWHLSVAKHA
ncbi:hypothetical protein JRQ81_016279, partial [Phrynocephalus forsythii]